MNMDLPPDNNEAIRRLLALKRHETPPPGYFRNFSSQVRARIERDAPPASGGLWDQITGFLGGNAWWRQPNALIGSGLALLAVTGFFLRNGPAPKTTPQRPQAAGLDFGGSSQGLAAAAASPAVHERLQLPSGMSYRIEILAIESNPPPYGLRLTPMTVSGMEWQR
jgi:hypothetical protein